MSNTPTKGLMAFFFLRSTFASLLVFLLVMSGLLAYVSMVKEALPDLGIPQATVQTEWAGADPETIEQQITNKIETKLKALKGLRKLRSASFNSFSMVAVEFQAHANMSDAMQRLRAKVNEAEADLPKEAEKPKIEPVSIDDTPILTIAVFGDLDDALLGRAAKKLKDRFEKVPGVNRVALAGRREEIIRIRMLPARMEALGLSPLVVRDRVQESNLDMPWDKFESDEIGSTFRLYGRFRDVESLRDLPVARLSEGRLVRLREIAEVRRDLERQKTRVALSWGGEPFRPCIDISVTKSSGADTLKIIKDLVEATESARLSPDWPHGMQYRVTSDQSIHIWTNLNNVFTNGWQAMLCVFAVLLVMLSWREALVAGLAIPVTFLGSLAVLWAFGYTLNEVVIIGMVLALGLLVDVFILMMEGMHEGMFVEGHSFAESALKTVKTYAGPAFAGQMTTILAMAPLLVISGIDGKFIRIIPVTAIICLAMSFVISLVVCIPLSRVLLERMRRGQSKTAVDRITEHVSDRLRRWSLVTTVRNRWTASGWVVGALALFVFSIMLASLLPSLLYPKADGRKLGVTMELPPGSSLDHSQRCADAVGEVLRQQPHFESVAKFVGKKSPLAQNSIGEWLTPETDTYLVGFSCMFTPRRERERLAYQYLPELREKIETELRRFPGTQLTFTPETGGSTTEDPVQIEVIGEDMDRLREISREVQRALANVLGASDVRDNLGPAQTDIKSLPKREALDFYRVTVDELANQIRFAMTDDKIGEYPIGGVEEDLDIRLSTAWPSRRGAAGGPTTPEEIAMLSLIRPEGQSLPIFSVADVVISRSALSITRKGGRRAVTVMSKTEGRTTNEILGDMQPVLEKMKRTWPAGYDYHFAGEAEASAETFASAGKMMVVALFLVFALLAIQFDSFRQPFIIMFSVPLALIGTCLGFFWCGIPFSFPAMIGVISLVGIVVNDAIVMIETMNNHLRAGMAVRDAAARGASDRLRPILSTTITTVVGLTPLALSDPMWMPLCTAIIFGLLAATFTSLLIIPCLYLLLTTNASEAQTEAGEPPLVVGE